jgi:hypothetical protein
MVGLVPSFDCPLVCGVNYGPAYPSNFQEVGFVGNDFEGNYFVVGIGFVGTDLVWAYA